jgi:membrane protein implicated in regulation of membrane protease activity
VLFQVPEVLAGGLVLVLGVRADLLSPGLGWVLFAAWVLKEAALFPFIRRAYEASSPTGGEALIGVIGLVTAPFAATSDSRRSGRVRLGPELWNARLVSGSQPAAVGGEVRVEAVEGLTLIVSAIESDEPPGAGRVTRDGSRDDAEGSAPRDRS